MPPTLMTKNDTTITQEAATRLFQIVYLSSAVRPFSTADLLKLLERARPRNLACGVTGLLLYHDGNFIQLLEGPEESVKQTHERILRDPRHDGFITLVRKPAAERHFSDWSMGFKKVSLAEVTKTPGLSDFLLNDSREESRNSSHPAVDLLHSFRKRLR